MSASHGNPVVISSGLVTETFDLSTTNVLAPPLGAVREELNATTGYRTKYRFVKNTSGSSIAANLAVVITADASNPNFVSVSATSSLPSRYRGVTTAAIAANYGGWVAYQGVATVTADGTTAITKNLHLIPGAATSGTFQSSNTAATVSLGTPLGSANIGTGTTGSALLTLPD
jgi:hypothetical protein